MEGCKMRKRLQSFIVRFFFIVLSVSVISGCQSIEDKESVNYYDYIKKVKESEFDDFSIMIRGSVIKDRPKIYDWDYTISNNVQIYTKMNTKKVHNLLLSESKFIGKPEVIGVCECGYRAIICLKNRNNDSVIKVLTTDAGFSFDQDSARLNRLFLNDKLLDWLIKQLNDAGLPETAANINKYCPRENKIQQ